MDFLRDSMCFWNHQHPYILLHVQAKKNGSWKIFRNFMVGLLPRIDRGFRTIYGDCVLSCSNDASSIRFSQGTDCVHPFYLLFIGSDNALKRNERVLFHGD